MKIVLEPTDRRVKATLNTADMLDHSNAMICREEIVAAVAPGGRLLLDFGSVQSIDSAGVGALVAVLKAVRRADGRMALINVPDQVMSVLKTIRLTTVFEIHADEASAMAAFESATVHSR